MPTEKPPFARHTDRTAERGPRQDAGCRRQAARSGRRPRRPAAHSAGDRLGSAGASAGHAARRPRIGRECDVDRGRAAEAHGIVVLAPDSRGGTWDVIREDYGEDVAFIDRALGEVFHTCRIDPARITLAGFSDGASYALSLGLLNGALFRDIIAFSPGFAMPAQSEDAPSIFISHGREDPVLPIERCGRRIAVRLRSLGYAVDYREFSGGHVVPPIWSRRRFAASWPERRQ